MLGPPLPAARPLSATIIGWLLFLFVYRRQTTICIAGLILLFVKYLHAHIALGFDEPGHCNKKAMVCTMHLPLQPTLPDMFGKI
jgi:hypothetical protein